MRRGWFRVYRYDKHSVGDHPSVAALLERVVVLARINVAPDCEIVVAESDMFEKLRPGDLAPEYRIIVTATNVSRDPDLIEAEFTFSAQRTDRPMMLGGAPV